VRNTMTWSKSMVWKGTDWYPVGHFDVNFKLDEKYFPVVVARMTQVKQVMWELCDQMQFPYESCVRLSYKGQDMDPQKTFWDYDIVGLEDGKPVIVDIVIVNMQPPWSREGPMDLD